MWCSRILRSIEDCKVQKRKHKEMLRDWEGEEPPEERERNKKSFS